MNTEHIAFTICTRSYLAGALVWRKTLLESGAGIRGLIYISDAEDEEIAKICDEATIMYNAYAANLIRDLRSINPNEIPDELGMRKRYSVIEYCTAIKPSLFISLADEFTGSIIHYFDPDIVILGDMAELREFSEKHNFTLLPHMNTPTEDGCRLSQLEVLRAGIFNFGYLGWNPAYKSGWQLIRWWQKQLLYNCRIALHEGIFVDQSWGVIFCCSPDAGIFYSKAYNAAYWNLHERNITFAEDSGYLVNGEKLHFYHFSGYSPSRPAALSIHQNRHILEGLRGLNQLCESYSNSLTSAGFAHWRNSYASITQNKSHKLKSDNQIATEIKQKNDDFSLVAEQMAEASTVGLFKNPRGFLMRAGCVWWIQYFAARISLMIAGHHNSRYRLLDNKSENAHQIALKSLENIDSINQTGLLFAGLRYWCKRFSIAAFGIRSSKITSGALEPVANKKNNYLKLDQEDLLKTQKKCLVPIDRVAVVGYLTAETGLGESVRGIVRAADSEEIDCDLFDIRGHYARSEDNEFSHRVHLAVDEPAHYKTCILHINADQIPSLLSSQPSSILIKANKRIGYWYWEMEQFPLNQVAAANYLDEIWVATNFVRESLLAANIKIPVRVIPPAISELTALNYGREHFELPTDRPVCLSVFDATSFLGRKNPLGVIKAMQKVYENSSEKPLLVLKTTNMKEKDLQNILTLAAPVDIKIINRYCTREETLSLIAMSDCFISLHRAEGLGLSLIDAMRLETPLVCTDYSGPRDFATEENAFLVPWKYCRARFEDGPYFGNQWAEPDANVAASQIISALRSADEKETKVAIAKASVESHFSRERIGKLFAEAIK